MKAKSIVLALMLATIGFSSCKKCITCTIPAKGNVPASSQDYCSMKDADRAFVTQQYKDGGGSCVDK